MKIFFLSGKFCPGVTWNKKKEKEFNWRIHAYGLLHAKSIARKKLQEFCLAETVNGNTSGKRFLLADVTLSTKRSGVVTSLKRYLWNRSVLSAKRNRKTWN